MHIAVFIKFFLFKNIIYVALYDSPVSFKQIRHLLLGQPYGIILQTDFNLQGRVRPVKYYLIVVR